jgi:hypothetical protein
MFQALVAGPQSSQEGGVEEHTAGGLGAIALPLCYPCRAKPVIA